VSLSECGTVNVALVSGDRSRPFISNVTEQLFVLHDTAGVASDAVKDVDDLIPVTLNGGAAVDNAGRGGSTSGTVAASSMGWRMALGSRERSYGSPFVFNSNLFFTSYIPASSAPVVGTCTVDTGVSRLYSLSLSCSSIGSVSSIFEGAAFEEVNQGPSSTPAVVVLDDESGNPQFVLMPSSSALPAPEEQMKKTSWRTLPLPQ